MCIRPWLRPSRFLYMKFRIEIILLFLLSIILISVGCESDVVRRYKRYSSNKTLGLTTRHEPEEIFPRQVWTIETVPLRSSRDFDAQLVEQIPRGTLLKINSSPGGGYFVGNSPDGHWGWVEASHVTPQAPDTPNQSTSPPPKPHEIFLRQVWTIETVPLRSGLNFGGRVLEMIPRGTLLNVHSSEQDWYFVDGDTLKNLGWVEASRVTPKAPDTMTSLRAIYKLTVNATPHDSTIKILNTSSQYKPGIERESASARVCRRLATRRW